MFNEGAYPIYASTSQMLDLFSNGVEKTCTALNPEKQGIVDNLCERVYFGFEIGVIRINSNGISFNELESSDISSGMPLEISPGNSVYVRFSIVSLITDEQINESGEFYVKFDDITMPYASTALTSE